MKLKPILPLVALFGALSSQMASAGTFLVDFGIAAGNPTQGAPTTSPDSNGNYWNNVTSTAVATNIAGGTGTTLNNLVSTTNLSSTISLTLTGAWKSSGIGNGGLNQNTPALGIYGIQTATQDYFYVESSSATLTISGLTPGAAYDLSMFGTRNVNAVRNTLYSLVDASGAHTTTLQTSGVGLGGIGYDGNNSTVAQLTGMVADGTGKVVLTVSNTGAGNNFGYLGVLGISEVPETSSALLICLGSMTMFVRRRSQG